MIDLPIAALAGLMGLVTYASRLAPFLAMRTRLPPALVRAMRPMGPATLAAVAAVSVSFPALDPGATQASVAAVWLGTGICVALVAIRRSLALGVVGALAAGAFMAST